MKCQLDGEPYVAESKGDANLLPPSGRAGLDTVIDFIGDDNLVWNTDYPHPDAPDPDRVLPWFSAQPMSDDSKRKILWDNAVGLYGFRLLESAP